MEEGPESDSRRWCRLSNALSFSTHSINPAALNHSRGSVFRPFQLLSKPRSRPQEADKPNPGSGIYVYTYTRASSVRVCKENGGGGTARKVVEQERKKLTR